MSNPDLSYGELFNSRLFAERNRIIFEYAPNADGEDMLVFLPFYENAKITETQTANYAEYNPIGRAGSLYAYTGSSSRKIKVKMSFTLPHLAFHPMGVDRFLRIFKGSSSNSEKLLFTAKSKYSPEAKPGDPDRSLTVAVEKMYNLLVDQELGGMSSTQQQMEAMNVALNVAGLGDLKAAMQGLQYSERHRIIDTLLFFVALLRTSVVNNAVNPLQGPPLLRLDYGTLYQAVPCLCKSYSLNWDESAGYDVATTTPRKIEISLSLEEVRVGDFSKYQPATMLKRDNLTGWESAVGSPHTIDPLPAAGFWGGGI